MRIVLKGVIAILKRVQEAARNVRDRLNRDSWRVINQLEEFGDNPTSDPLDLLENTLFTLSAFSGFGHGRDDPLPGVALHGYGATS